ncbi:MAG: tripartite tricarboxylate transporter substrate-binding protein [Betaproteobacteria bacterium]|jgi:tripartite-type tricarboxylate transporter receptor subunit TctC
MKVLKLLLALSLTLGLVPTVSAQDNWPQKPIRLLLGFPAGGGSDIVARLVAKSLGDRIGQSVVVDNKPGAGGNIATEMLVRAPGDGYTLLLVPSGHASGAAMKKSLPFDPIKDLAWVSTITTYPLAFTVAPNSPIKSYADLIQKAKAEPNKYTYSSVGIGTAMHLAAEWAFGDANVQVTHIPFKGGTGPMTELLAGRLDVMVDTMTLTASLLKDQRVRAIAVTSPPGGSPVQGVPAIADQYPGVIFESWLGIAAPANTPPELVERLNKELRAVLSQEDVKQKLISFGGSPNASSPNEFKMRVERDIRNLKKVIQDKKIELE